MRVTRSLMLWLAVAMAAGGCAQQPVMRAQMAAAPAPQGIDNVIYGPAPGYATAAPAYGTPQARGYFAPSGPGYAMAPAPTYQAPAKPLYATASAPAYQAHAKPLYATASAPAYQAPARPLYAMAPASTYAAPAAPTYATAPAPTYAAPAAPTYAMAPAPTYPAPAAPTYATAPAPTYAMAPAPTYAMAPAPTYPAPAAPTYAMAPAPTYPAPAAPTYSAAPSPLYASTVTPDGSGRGFAGGLALNGRIAAAPVSYSGHSSGYSYAPNSYAPTVQGPYTLDSGDRLRIVVFGQEGLTNSYVLDASGQIQMPLIGQVPARGLTADQLSERIGEMLRQGFIREPHVAVEIESYRPFFILGEITQPGQYPYVANMTVETAVAIAGGFGPRAARKQITISRNYGGQVQRFEAPVSYPVQPGDTIQVQERWF